MKTVAIIGFGFCGRIVAFHLSQRSDIKLIIFDQQDFLKNIGPAFSQFSQHYILNVEAKNMSAFSDKENDFCDFLKKCILGNASKFRFSRAFCSVPARALSHNTR